MVVHFLKKIFVHPLQTKKALAKIEMKQKMDHQRNCKSNDQDIARKPPAYQFTVAVLPLLIF